MGVGVVIAICILLLFAYVFDLTASKTKVPAVILLLLLGWGLQQFVSAFEIKVLDLSHVLLYLGTVGLILIVLEGSLELEINSSKTALIRRSFMMAFIPMIILALILAGILYFVMDIHYKSALGSIIPICIISSALAIPSVKYLSENNREFITYESSLSDIIGIVFFNFIVLNDVIELASVTDLLLKIFIILLVSIASILFLSFFIKKIDHHIKFTPVIIIVILIYFIVKHYHLPALIFIVLFGLFLGNFDELKKIRWMKKFSNSSLKEETTKFHELITEATFLVRSVFFLLFGFLINTSELLNLDSFIWAILIVALIYIIRAVQLKITGIPISPFIYIAPRGLITILLFLSLPVEYNNHIINNALIIQVIVITSLIMMIGLILNKPVKVEEK